MNLRYFVQSVFVPSINMFVFHVGAWSVSEEPTRARFSRGMDEKDRKKVTLRRMYLDHGESL